MERLHKFLSGAGVASRRQAEELIRQGQVKVNGQVVWEMGVRIDPQKDKVQVDGKDMKVAPDPIYVMLNKPKYVVTTMVDPQHRKTVAELVKNEIKSRIYPVGRLDYMTEGLLILTNDGDLTYRLTHPKYKVDKTYQVLVKGVVNALAQEKLRNGIELEDGWTAPAKVKRISSKTQDTALEITIHEGRNRQVRRMLQALGYEVLDLKRVSFGPLVLGTLKLGGYRRLSVQEVRDLKRACGLI